MVAVYRFFGTTAEIGGVAVLDSLGQKVSLEDGAGMDAMRGGCILLPEAEYLKLGITAEEEKKYRYPGARSNAPADFKAKLNKGLVVRQKLLDEDAMGIPASSIPDVTIGPPSAAPTVEVKK